MKIGFTYMMILSFCGTNFLFSQEKIKFYTALYINYTLSKVHENSPQIGLKKSWIPVPSIGLGALKIFKSGFYLNTSLVYQTWFYRATTKAFRTKNNTLSAGPILNANIGRILNRNKDYKIFIDVGGSLGYSSDFETEYILTDSVAQRQFIMHDKRISTVTSFASIETGILFPGHKRSYMISIRYSYGFQIPFRSHYTYKEKGNTYIGSLSGRDSFIGLHFKWFFKNRKSDDLEK